MKTAEYYIKSSITTWKLVIYLSKRSYAPLHTPEVYQTSIKTQPCFGIDTNPILYGWHVFERVGVFNPFGILLLSPQNNHP